MITQSRPLSEGLLVDRKRLQQLAPEINRQFGLDYDPDATADNAREMTLEDGVKPKDNLFSCEIIVTRDCAKALGCDDGVNAFARGLLRGEFPSPAEQVADGPDKVRQFFVCRGSHSASPYSNRPAAGEAESPRQK